MNHFFTPFALITLGLVGCAPTPVSGPLPSAPTAPHSALSKRRPSASLSTFVDPGPPIKVLSEIDKGEQDIEKKAEQLLQSGQYEKIEALAAQYRHSQEIFPNGEWKLASVYRGIAVLADAATDAQWGARRMLVEAWAKKKPGSVTAQVALIRVLESGAGRARGDGWASTITPAGRQKMTQLLQEADFVLQTSAKLRKQCPGWYAAAQRIGLLDSWPRKNYDAVVDEGIRLFPSYFDFHFSRTNYLLPRWFGKPGEMEKYATQVSDRAGGGAGDVLYARIVWSMVEDRFTDDIFRDTQVSWPRAHKGFVALMKRYPHSLDVANAYAELAYLKCDRPTAKDLFQNHIKNRVALNYWTNTGWFTDCRDWALGKN